MRLECDLSKVADTDINILLNTSDIDELSKLGLTKKEWRTSEKEESYIFVKYIKQNINLQNICSLGLFRSVLFYKNQLKCYSPPKSLNINIFVNNFQAKECLVEEFVEGTMINIFYDNESNKWEIVSKSTVGGNVTYFKEQPTFKELFNEICTENNITFDNLPKDNCYSFVFQHPKNKFVIPIVNKRIVLVAVYNISGYQIKELDKDEYIKFLNNVDVPYKIEFNSYEDLVNNYGSNNTPYTIMGVVVKHTSGVHTKIRNPNYENLKSLRGNCPKLQYQYLFLRSSQNVEPFLRYFPENKEAFEKYRNQVHKFTRNLHNYYIKCFVKKEIVLKDAPFQYKPHLYNLHKKYIEMIGTGGIITKMIVIEYINHLHPAKLMHSLNYSIYKNDNNYNVNNCEVNMDCE